MRPAAKSSATPCALLLLLLASNPSCKRKNPLPLPRRLHAQCPRSGRSRITRRLPRQPARHFFPYLAFLTYTPLHRMPLPAIMSASRCPCRMHWPRPMAARTTSLGVQPLHRQAVGAVAMGPHQAFASGRAEQVFCLMGSTGT
ncbi:hypothetical protein BCR44DRAFT_1429915 [Catenaria anguillulae PL171]|uniref:Secreted protein n=1 Tax=Catenaria anguillulae PL171 TaxID=765915 RepID=A0A1Y2HT41_9FUNG|nr:hypothetical protein BCR44DRAFT_1429915 [Catenaria anguillulae PL171]